MNNLKGCIALLTILLWIPASIGQVQRFCFRPPTIDNSLPISPPNLGNDRYTVGTVVTFRCVPGYTNLGATTARCANRQWFIGQQARPSCQRRSTTPPPPPPPSGCAPNLCPANSDCVIVDNTPRCLCRSGFMQSGSTCIPEVTTPTPTPRPVPTTLPPLVCRGGCNVPNSACILLRNQPRCVCNVGYLEFRGTCIRRTLFTATPGQCNRACPPNSQCGNINTVPVCACNVGFVVYNAQSCIPRPTCSRPTSLAPFLAISAPASQAVWQIGASLQFTCAAGYILQGSASISCSPRATLSVSLPTCVRIPTQPPTPPVQCSRPPPSRFRITIPNNFQQFWNLGSVITYGCTNNYIIQGFRQARCLASGQFMNPPPNCIPAPTQPPTPPVRCGRPPPSRFRITIPNNSQQFWNLGSVITYGCTNNYIIQGFSQARCLASGQFMNPPPNCIAPPTVRPTPTIGPPGDCIIPISPENGNFAPRRPVWVVGDTVTYTCNAGYRLQGVSIQTCRRDGSYTSTPPLCLPMVTCSEPVLQFGVRTDPDIRRPVPPGTRFRFFCEAGLRLVGNEFLTCQAAGGYDNAFPFCTSINPVTTPGTIMVCRRPPDAPFRVTTPDNNRQTWNAGDIISYACANGYVLQGFPRARCLEGGMFMNPPPTCSLPAPVVCNRPPNVQFRIIVPDNNRQTWNIGDIITYQCTNNYILDGSSMARCLGTGEFMNPPPDCNEPAPVTPTPPTICLRPRNLDESLSIVPDNSQQFWFVDSIISYACSSGFDLQGAPMARCLASGTFMNPPPTCTPTQQATVCTSPPIPTNGFVQPLRDGGRRTSWSVGEVIFFGCDTPLILVGQNSTVCNSDGRFSPVNSFCVGVPTTPPSTPPPARSCGRPTLSENVVLPTERNTFMAGETITFQCTNERFILRGEAALSCTATGEFSGEIPRCELIIPIVRCPRPITLPSRLSATTNSLLFGVGDTITFQCEPGFTLVGDAVLQCQENGEFDGSIPGCAIPIAGQTCTVPQRTGASTSVNGTVPPGQSVTYACTTDSRYPMLVGSATVQCQANGELTPQVPFCTACRPESPVNGSVSPNSETIDGFGFGINDIINYVCDEGFQPTSGFLIGLCQQNNEIVGELPTCTPETEVSGTSSSCDIPPLINGVVAPIFEAQMIGNITRIQNEAVVRFSCNAGFVLDGVDISICSFGRLNPEMPTCQAAA